jgi:hypothetical protein
MPVNASLKNGAQGPACAGVSVEEGFYEDAYSTLFPRSAYRLLPKVFT